MTRTEGRLAHPPASRWLSETGPEACHVKDKARDRLPPHLLLPSTLRATNHSPLHGASSLSRGFRNNSEHTGAGTPGAELSPTGQLSPGGLLV